MASKNDIKKAGIKLMLPSSVFYFYIDEGGLLGNCIVAITEKPLDKPADIEMDYLSDYFFGLLTLTSIIRHLYMFHTMFPRIKIEYNTESDVIFDAEEILLGKGGNLG